MRKSGALERVEKGDEIMMAVRPSRGIDDDSRGTEAVLWFVEEVEGLAMRRGGREEMILNDDSSLKEDWCFHARDKTPRVDATSMAFDGVVGLALLC